MTPELISRLEQDFAEFPNLKAEPAAAEQINGLEEFAGFALPGPYKEFVRRFGCAILGSLRIYGVGRAEVMGEEEGTPVTVTAEFRDDDWPGTESWFIFSTDLSGNPIGFDRDGRVHLSDHDAGEIVLLAESFEQFLWKYCLNQ